MKKQIAVILISVMSHIAICAERQMETNLDRAIEVAQKDNKLVFIKYGREKCGNCRHLDSLINKKDIRLLDSEFVLVDLNCDAPSNQKAFYKLYRNAFKDAKALPFVVIASADGSLINSFSGYIEEEDYNKFIRDAKNKSKKLNQ